MCKLAPEGFAFTSSSACLSTLLLRLNYCELHVTHVLVIPSILLETFENYQREAAQRNRYLRSSTADQFSRHLYKCCSCSIYFASIYLQVRVLRLNVAFPKRIARMGVFQVLPVQ